MDCEYPRPQDVGIRIPPRIREDRFCAGFQHALKGGQLSQVKYLRRSFRLGYRAAKLYVRELRRREGILSFPIQGRLRIRVASDQCH
ncbi:MAG: hypothetical protein ACE5NW_12370 [Acidiferrobacterales bacterium]